MLPVYVKQAALFGYIYCSFPYRWMSITCANPVLELKRYEDINFCNLDLFFWTQHFQPRYKYCCSIIGAQFI